MVKSIFVNVKINANDKTVKFDNNSILKDKKIKNILNDNSIATDTNGVAIVPDNYYLILKHSGSEIFNLSKNQLNYAEYHRPGIDAILDVEQCSINFFAPATVGGSILLIVFYEDETRLC